eukprot:6208744-Pleurochrysis_carterae.AAC.3
MDNAKPPKDPPSILRPERELRQQRARRRDRVLGADCLERRRGNQLRDGERGDRKSGPAVTRPKRSSMLSNAANSSIVCQPDPHTPPRSQKLSRTHSRRRCAPLLSLSLLHPPVSPFPS